MTPDWTHWLLILAAWWAFTALFAAVTAIAGAMAGLKPETITIGIGPALIRFRAGSALVRLRPIPWGSAAGFEGDPGPSDEAKLPALFRLPRLRRLPVLLAGPALTFATGALLLAAGGRAAAVAGVIGIVQGAFNLLPLPGLNGGFLMLALIEGKEVREPGNLYSARAVMASLLAIAAFHLGFLYFLGTQPDRVLAWFGAGR